MGKFRLASVFTDGCVLQRNKEIAVFGTGEEGANVKVTLNGITVACKVVDGSFKAFLPKMEAATGLTLMVSSQGTDIVCKDVAIGEVWLAGGQSNMEFELQNVIGGADMLTNDKPNVRFYYTPKYSFEDDESRKMDEESHWEHFGEAGTKHWSAVGYMFAKQLSETLGVTVGVIGCNWGGTSASCWMAEEDLERGWADVQAYLTDYKKGIEGKSLSVQKTEYEDYLRYRAEWEPKCNKLYEENPDIEWATVEELIGESKYPGPVNEYSPFRPCGLYKTMLKKVIEYTLAGVIFYQGESDDHKPHAYYNLFHGMVARWRKDNGDMLLPFIPVQLPMHRYKQDPDFKNWPEIRRAQRKVTLDNKNMGLAVAIDCGEWNDIHPKNKTEVSRRLALMALNMVYGVIEPKEANGPRAMAVEYQSDACIITAEFSDGGYENRGDRIVGFEIAPFVQGGAKDEDYVEATAEILPDNRIKVFAPSVHNPGYVRYLWTNWGNVTLYGKNGLPFEPFRA